MIRHILILFSVVLLFSSCKQQNNYKLVWSDEFDYTGLPNELKWNYDTVGNAWGWGNNELQYYTTGRKENAWVDNGKLHITARKEKGFPNAYTSARLTSKHKGDWLYGRFEVRAKLCRGIGIWPAIWMLPTENKYGNWPHSGEIDMMEHVGYHPDTVYFTVHTGAFNGMQHTQKGGTVYLPKAEDAFYTYALEWSETKCDFFVDDKKVFTFKKESNDSEKWPFDDPFHLLLNVAVGGNWGGIHGVDDAIFPQTMEVDYVRVYQK
ncbi:glycoside hydrolase family 16 protein [Saccharicrinis fermentans]|uniref:Beta-glucanase n=1 Tax=Saccharicrinis fermentans DSM 9555 = JCM 21142 TaxID=869213 RepID=W7Y9M0_9BACT|nr:glycoside hydrolase family 16 protein [Saccharicrinis fermentans]GAF04198.1 beta-glucanase precursor [Saccharicrinis fermentans DSM 9555 = JCM 21142]